MLMKLLSYNTSFVSHKECNEALDQCIAVIVFIWLMGVIAIEYINWQYNPTSPTSHVIFPSS